MTTIVPRRSASQTAPRVDRPTRSFGPTRDTDLLALITGAQSAENYEAALRTLCAGLRQLTGCDRVVLGLSNRRAECRAVEVSGEVRVDRRSEMTRAAEAALDETLTHSEPMIWSVGDDSPIFARLTRLAAADALVGISLRDAQDRPIGAVLLFGNQTWQKTLDNSNLLTDLQQPIASTLALIRETRGTIMRRVQQGVMNAARKLRSKLVIASVVVLAAALVMPVPFKPNCNFTVEPVKRRYVAAPFDGTLQSTLVEPGDIVRTGQVLAVLDERELRWELAGLEAEYVAAKKKRDAARAKHEAAPAQLAKLEMDQIDTKLRTLRHRTEHLKIQCPMDGVVVSGDLRRTEGAPLSIGQSLFEIAPLDKMIAEIEVSQDDVSFIRAGMSANLRFDAFPHTKWSGAIAKVNPRAELRQGQTVFVAEVHLDNKQRTLRPGMNGRAKITVANRSLGWIIFHRPMDALAQRIGW